MSLREIPYINTYLKNHASILAIQDEESDAEKITFISETEYHNFVVLATILGRSFVKNKQQEVIQPDIKIFFESIREELVNKAVKKFYEKSQTEKNTGPLYEAYASFEYNNVSCADLLSVPYEKTLERIKFHAEKKGFEIFSKMVDDIASNLSIEIVVLITKDLWSLRFNHSEMSCLFFEAPSNESLYEKILSPAMKDFYVNFRE